MAKDNFRVYVVEDDEYFNKLLVHTLSLNPDHEVKGFKTGEALVKAFHEQPADFITVDYRLPDMKGDEVVKTIKELSEDTELVVISEQGEIQTAVSLLKHGAFDYIVKTKDIRDRLLQVVELVKKQSGLKKRIASLEQELGKKYDFGKGIIGESPQIKQVFTLLEKAIKTPITVSISGETGTGKEVIAKAIHFNSKRAKKPFVPVNVAAIPSELIESELFGHEKGAFTGAHAQRKGKFEEANGGTLFLDEIGEMDLNMQVKLLRVLQERELNRVGGNKAIKIDTRIVVATHKNLQDEVKKGNFREDLYYRLFGLRIEMPPLRARGDDILLLAKFFMDNFSKEHDLDAKGLTDAARSKLMSHSWPGNVRELKSVMELAMVMANGDKIDADDISLSTNDVLPDIMGTDMSLREYNQQIVNLYMKRFDNDTKKVAQELKIGQTTVYRLLKEQEQG